MNNNSMSDIWLNLEVGCNKYFMMKYCFRDDSRDVSLLLTSDQTPHTSHDVTEWLCAFVHLLLFFQIEKR